MTGHPLSEILAINNKNMQDALVKMIDKLSSLNFDSIKDEDIKLLVHKGYYDFIVALERDLEKKEDSSHLFDVVIASRIYNDNELFSLYRANLLHELYAVTKEPNILKCILSHGVKIFYMNDFRKILPREYRIKFLDDIIDNILISYYKDPNKFNMIEYFDTFEIDYICEKMLSDNKMNIDYAFFFLEYIYSRKVNRENESALLDKILLSKNPKYIYLLLDVCSNEKSIKLLEKALKETNDFEYNFYYNLKKNKAGMAEIFCGTFALKLFLENNTQFKDKSELNKIIVFISDKDMVEIESKWKTDLLNVMFSDSDVESKNNGVVKKKNNSN